MLRPSLSGGSSGSTSPPGRASRVAGVYAPAFVERLRRSATRREVTDRRVAGVYAPAFVERCHRRASRTSVKGQVSPEFMLRPSLSDLMLHRRLDPDPGVAGVYAPAFVERDARWLWRGSRRSGVAGVYAPAFVERGRAARPRPASRRVAGVYAPAFVERRRMPPSSERRVLAVSPEFMLRPSLSGAHRNKPDHLADKVSPEFMLRPSLSVQGLTGKDATETTKCRRSLCSGLR